LFVQQSHSLCDLRALSEQGERALLKAGAGDWGQVVCHRENLFVLFVQQSDSLCDLRVLSEQGERALLKAGTGGWGLVVCHRDEGDEFK